MKNVFSKLSNKFAILKEAKLNILNVFDMIIIEMNEAKLISENIIKIIKK